METGTAAAASSENTDHFEVRVAGHSNAGRYELVLNGAVVGFAITSIADQTMTIAHVETNREHRGKDFAARLMAGVLHDARARSLTVDPTCSYAAAYMQRHRETHDLVTPVT